VVRVLSSLVDALLWDDGKYGFAGKDKIRIAVYWVT